MNFLNNLDPDIRNTLLIQLRNLWRHTTTVLEGNSLTLARQEQRKREKTT